MPKNQHYKISPASQINKLSTRKYDNIHLKSKTEMRKVQENTGKLEEGRKTITDISRVYSQIMPIAVDNRAKNYPNMAKKENETKQKAGYNPLDSKAIKERSSESGIASQKENKLLKPKIKREAEYFLSISKREVKSKTNKSSNLPLEESILKSEKTTQIISNSVFMYNSTRVQNILITNANSNSNPMSEISPASQINKLSTRKYDNIHLKSKTEMRKVQENTGKLEEGRKTITDISRVYSQIMPIAVDNRAKNYPNMAKKENETKQKAGYNPLDSKAIKERSSESGIASQKENKLLKPKIKREAEYFLSISKR